MILLQPDQYTPAVFGLRAVSINNLYARSVVEEHVDGRVYVDDAANPRAFYIVHPYGMSLLYGEISEAFLQSQLKDHILGRNGLRTGGEFLQVFPTELQKRIDGMLGDHLCIHGFDKKQNFAQHAVIKYQRINFKFNLKKFEELLSNIDLTEYDFREVDVRSYNETEGSVVPKKFWNNASDFLSCGVGFLLMYDNQSVAVAFSSFLHGTMLEMGMETTAEFRRKGFGSIVCVKLIQYCLKKGFEPVWACGSGNQGSFNLALKLGFEPTAYLPYYVLL